MAMLWDNLRDNSPDTIIKSVDMGREQIVITSTPSGDDSPFMKAYKKAEQRAHSISLGDYKGEEMARFENDTVAKVTENVKQETVDVALINVGEIVFNMGGSVVERFAPKLTWYEKIFTSKEKRELAVMVGTYVAIQAVKMKYNHYIIDAVSAYLNFEMQKKLLGGLNQETLDKLFSKFEKTNA